MDSVTGKIQSLSLAWPPASLSPNGSHGHWSPKAKARREYKAACFYAAKGQGLRRMGDAGLHVEIVFHAPTARAYDLDNALARLKTGLDAVALVTGIDDSKWTYTLRRGAKERGGRVAITLRPALVDIPFLGVIA